MNKRPFFLLLILLLEIIISVHSQRSPPPPSVPPILRFVLQWPPTFCMQLNSEQNARCQEPIPQHEFTLHGLWPADAQGYVITCPEQTDPNWNQLFTPTMENQLMEFWPALREGSQKRDIWKHEWRAHGVCGGTTAQVYFNRAIGINKMLVKGNLFNYLKTNGIIACDSLSFPKNDIVEAIRKVFVKSPSPTPPALDVYLTCIPIDSKNTTHVYLNEVTLCTNSDGTSFISCPPNAAPRESCSTSAEIMLPHPKPQPSVGPTAAGISEGNRWDISYV